MCDVMFLFHSNCPVCGAQGKLWKKEPETFICPKCLTVFSEFGIVLEPYEEQEEIWT
jgi:hypothetical protein